MNILEEIAERTRVRIAEEEAAKPLAQLRKEAEALCLLRASICR